MDSLNWHRKTILKTSKLYKNSLAIIGRDSKKSSLVLIGNKTSISMYNSYTHEFIKEIKLQNSFSSTITAVTLSDDLLFFAAGTKIGAISIQNQKIMFELDTYLATESIDAVHVHGWSLWVVTGNMINQFMMAGAQLGNKATRAKQCRVMKTEDIHSNLFDANINQSVLIVPQEQDPFLFLLKTNNELLCYANGLKESLASVKTHSPPISLNAIPEKYNEFYIGFADGSIWAVSVTKKKIKKLFVIESQGREKVNHLIEIIQGSLIVFRPSSMQVWGKDHEILGSQELNQKVVTGCFIPSEQSIICGTSQGHLLELCSSQNLLKEYQKQNKIKERDNLVSEICNLRKQKEQMERKLKQMNKVPAKNKFTVNGNISLDYHHLCYVLEISSELPLKKIIVKGPVELISKEGITFSGVEKNKDKESMNCYILQYEQTRNARVLVFLEQEYHEDCKLTVMIFGQEQKAYAITQTYDLKPISLHHKIPQIAAVDPAHLLEITGEFKYFEMNMWMNTLFNDFGPSPYDGNQFSVVCYESLLTKQKILVKYRNKHCIFLCQSTIPLTIIKKSLQQKAKEKHLSLNYNVQVNKQITTRFIKGHAERFLKLQEAFEQKDLLPGLMELKNEPNLSEDLKNILENADSLNRQCKQNQRQFQQLKQQFIKAYTSYRKLIGYETSNFEIDLLVRQLSTSNEEKLLDMFFK